MLGGSGRAKDAPPEREAFSEGVKDLQGNWSDDLGLTIEITGTQARFSDSSGTYAFERADGAMMLRGAQLIGTTAAPVWQFPTGVERKWARVQPSGTGDRNWAQLFWRYKAARVQQRADLQAAFQNQDFERVTELRARWEDGSLEVAGAALLSGEMTPEQQGALFAGARLVSGVCIRHRRFKYRGVIIGCEPWCTAPAQWRAQMGVPQLPKGEAQPFYHCLVDQRDREAGTVTFAAEENLEPDSLSFPIQANMLEELLVPSAELGGYLLSQRLHDAMNRQMVGGGLVY